MRALEGLGVQATSDASFTQAKDSEVEVATISGGEFTVNFYGWFRNENLKKMNLSARGTLPFSGFVSYEQR